MYDKISRGQVRRSSAPKRLSSALLRKTCGGENREVDAVRKTVGDGKKSFIPRITTVDRDGERRISGQPRRSRSADRCSGISHPGSVIKRSRSNENFYTPIHGGNIQGTSARRTTTGHKSVKKDVRPLTDKNFQNVEISKVLNYVLEHAIISQEQVAEFNKPMSLKMFVHITSSLLAQYFPEYPVTFSNYCELIPLLMKKLKYPSNITRSCLVTANSPHSWPNIVGILSWLVRMPKMHDYKYVVVEDNTFVDTEKMAKLLEYHRQEYLNWVDGAELIAPGNRQFIEELFLNKKLSLEDQLNKTKEKVKELHDIAIHKTDEELAIGEKLKNVRATLSKIKSTKDDYQKRVHTLQVDFERKSKLKLDRKQQNEIIKKKLADNKCRDDIKSEDVQKLQSESCALKKVIKLQDTHIADINNECYTADIAIARLQGKLDAVRLKHQALLRNCTSVHMDFSELLVQFGSDKTSSVTEYVAQLGKVKHKLKTTMKDYKEEEKIFEKEMCEGEDRLKIYKEEIHQKQKVSDQLDTKKVEIKKICADVQDKLKIQKQHVKEIKGKQCSMEQTLDSKKNEITAVEKKLQMCSDVYSRNDVQYRELLKTMGEDLQKYASKLEQYFQEMMNFL